MKRGKPLARRTPLKPGKPLKRTGFKRKPPGDSGQAVARKPRKRLPVESAKHKAERPARAAVVAEVRARDGGCVGRRYGHDHVCGGPLDVHEIVSRARWRAGYLVADNCVTLCRVAHDWVTTHPAEASSLGLLRSAALPR